MQALFQSAQHIYEKREWSGSAPLTTGSGSGRPKNMRIRICWSGSVPKCYGSTTLVTVDGWVCSWRRRAPLSPPRSPKWRRRMRRKSARKCPTLYSTCSLHPVFKSGNDVFVPLTFELQRLKQWEKMLEISPCDGSNGKPKRQLLPSWFLKSKRKSFGLQPVNFDFSLPIFFTPMDRFYIFQ